MIQPVGVRACLCAGQHRPQVDPLELQRHHVWPLGEGGPDVRENLRWLCASTHVQVHRLWRYYKRYDGAPPWWLHRTFSPYVRDLVATGWAQKRAAA